MHTMVYPMPIVAAAERQAAGPAATLARRYSDWNYGWQADIALRYVPVAKYAGPPRLPRSSETSEVGRMCRQTSEVSEDLGGRGVILDVGCGSKGGVTSYLPLRTVGVDLAFNVGRIRRHPAVTPVVGSGLALPARRRQRRRGPVHGYARAPVVHPSGAGWWLSSSVS